MMHIRSLFGICCLIIMFTLVSCEKFLDTQPSDFVSPDEYYTSEEQLTFALAGVYDVLGRSTMYGLQMVARNGLTADEAFYARASVIEGIQVFNYSAADAAVLTFWRDLYNGINRANQLLANIDKPEMDESARNVIKGQAMFLRAYYYFLLASNWGGVPLLTEPTTSTKNAEVPRASLEEVYTFITAEMIAAEPLVSTATEWGHG